MLTYSNDLCYIYNKHCRGGCYMLKSIKLTIYNPKGAYSYNLTNKYFPCNISIENTTFCDEFH